MSRKKRWTVIFILTIFSALLWGNDAQATKSLSVTISDVNTNSSLESAQWKLSTEQTWRDSGTSDRFTEGAYIINFKTPGGYADIPDRAVTLSSNMDLVVFAEMSFGTPVLGWPLWPVGPFAPYDAILFEPLSFTIVGSERNYLAWSENIPGAEHSVWGGKIHLSDLSSSTTSTTESDDVFSSRNLSFWRSIEEDTFSLDSLSSDDIGVLRRYISEWVVVSDDTGEVTVPNQEIIVDDYNDLIEDWALFLGGDGKGGFEGSYIGDTGHASPTMIYVDNIWIANMPGYRAYRKYLTNAYQTGGWGDGVLLIPTNEGMLHAFGLDPFEEKWGIMPFPNQALGYFQMARKVLSGSTEMPRMNLLDGPLGFADVVSDLDNTWRRVVVGTSGTGLTLENKPGAFYEQEYSLLGKSPTLGANLISQYAPKARNNPHFWGIYAVNLADNGTAQVQPGAPELLWSVSSVYYEEDSAPRGSVFINGSQFKRNNDGIRDVHEVPDAYKGYQDVRLSCARPVVGMTRDDNGDAQWHVLLVGITHDNAFHLYDLDADTGEILEDIDLGNYPTAYAGGMIYKDGAFNELTEEHLSSSLGGSYGLENIFWDERFEWKFPTRIGAIAKDEVRDLDPENLSQARLYKDPLLKEVYVHLSNGALYLWDVSKPKSSTNPVMVALSVYQSDFTDPDPEEDDGTDLNNTLVAGPSTQDFDGTYLPVEDGDETVYHRSLALALKGGDSTDTKKIDLRALVVMDVDNILKAQKVFLVSQANTWSSFGSGNKDRVDYDGGLGWSVPLAAGDANEGKYWNEVLTISAPVFLDGHIILAGYQPDNNKSWVLNIDAQPNDNEVIVGQETGYDGVEFVGGATINNSGPDGQAQIFVGTSTGGTVSQDIDGVAWDGGFGSDDSVNDKMKVIYWRTNN